MGSLVRICAITAASFVALSFALFAIDQLSEGSENQVRSVTGGSERAPSPAVIEAPAPRPEVERFREKAHSGLREAIDDVDDVLLSPFKGIVDSNEVWVQRLVPGALGLILYGFVGMLLANLLPQRKQHVRDWREAPG